jgi:hypothetical protein
MFRTARRDREELALPVLEKLAAPELLTQSELRPPMLTLFFVVMRMTDQTQHVISSIPIAKQRRSFRGGSRA